MKGIHKIVLFLIAILTLYFGGYKILYMENITAATSLFNPRLQNITPLESNASDFIGDFKLPDEPLDASAPGLTPGPENHLVVIDAGHGGNDPGTRDNGLTEKEVALDITLRLDSILKSSDIKTYMTRTDDTYIDHKDRILKANDMNASLFISLHCDWYSDPSFRGTQTLYYPSKSLFKGNLLEIDYAYIIQRELINTLKTHDRGINDRPNLAVLRHAKMPSVLVELAFLSNKQDSQQLASGSFRQKTAEALAEGIKKSLARIDSK